MLRYAGKAQLRSAFFLVLWSLSFSCAMLMTKRLSDSTPQTLLMFVRSGVGLVAMIPFWYPFRPWHLLCSPNAKWLIIRGILQASGMWFSYAGYRYLPGETAAFLGTSGPFFILLSAYIFLKEKLDAVHWWMMGVGYIGILCILNPFSVTFSHYAILPILSNMCMALSLVLTRYLIIVKEEQSRILFSNAFLPFLCLSGVFLWNHGESMVSNDIAWGALVSIGIFGGMTSVFHFYALKFSSAAFVAIFDYFRLIVFLALNYTIYQEAMKLNTWIGGSIIVIATFISVLLHQKYRKTL